MKYWIQIIPDDPPPPALHNIAHTTTVQITSHEVMLQSSLTVPFLGQPPQSYPQFSHRRSLVLTPESSGVESSRGDY